MNTPTQHQHVIKINPSVYSLELITAVSTSMKDEAFFIFETEGSDFIVTINAKDSSKSSGIKNRFEQKLQAIHTLRKQAEENKELKKEVIRQALMHQFAPRMQEVGFEDSNLDDLEASLLEFEQESLEDPLGISKPWNG